MLCCVRRFSRSQKAIVEEWFNPTNQYIDAFVIEGIDPETTVDHTELQEFIIETKI